MEFDVDRLMALWDEPPGGAETDAAFRQVYADPVVLNGTPATVAVLVAMARGLHRAVADQSREVRDIFVTPGRAAVAFVVRGRHVGPLPTRIGTVPASGQLIEMSVIDMFTLVDGLIAEVWAVSDELGLLSSVGAVTLTGEPATTVETPE
jgi:predicted ester cyclase